MSAEGPDKDARGVPGEGPTSADSTVGPEDQLGAGRSIGQYTLVRQIASGGMGVVYEARQQHPSPLLQPEHGPACRPHCAPVAVHSLRHASEVLASTPLHEGFHMCKTSKWPGRIAGCLGVASITLLAGAAAAAPPAALSKGEGKLDIVAWPGYIERGESDKAYDWVTGFEKATGCKVTVKTAGTSDEMVSLMNQGGFDLVTASGDASLRMVAGEKVQPINAALVPSYKTVDPRLQNAAWHTVCTVRRIYV